MSETYAEYLHRMLEERGIKRSSRARTLQEITNCSKQASYNWLDGTSTPTYTYSAAIDKWFERQRSDQQFEISESVPASEWDQNTPLLEDEVEVPLFNELEIAAGSGSDIGYEHHGPVIRFSRSSLRKANVPPESAFFVKIRGNSMEPKYEEGGEAGFNRAATRIIDGEEYAIDHDGLARFKILYRLPKGKVRISSYNSDEYPDEIVPETEIRVIGQLFSYQKMKTTG